MQSNNKGLTMNEAQKIGWYVTDAKDKDVFGPTSEQAARTKCKALGGDAKGFNVSYVSDYSAKRQMEKESIEVSQFSLIQELLQLDELETPGLKLGALKLDTQDNCIYVTIGGQKYKYTPNVADKAGQVYASVTGMAKHSTGKALAFLKKNATGEKLNEDIELMEAQWQCTLDIKDAWGKAQDDEITSAELAKVIASKLKALKLSFFTGGLEHLKDTRDELVNDFESMAEDKDLDKDDFDITMEELYNWADISLDRGWNGKTLCCI